MLAVQLKNLLGSKWLICALLATTLQINVLSQKKSPVDKPDFIRLGDVFGLIGHDGDGATYGFGVIYRMYGLEYGTKLGVNENYLSALYTILPSSRTQILSLYVKGGIAWIEETPSSSGTQPSAYDYRYKPMAGFGCFIYPFRNISIGLGWSTFNGPFISAGVSLTEPQVR
jgi:hypothetical protein